MHSGCASEAHPRARAAADADRLAPHLPPPYLGPCAATLAPSLGPAEVTRASRLLWSLWAERTVGGWRRHSQTEMLDWGVTRMVEKKHCTDAEMQGWMTSTASVHPCIMHGCTDARWRWPSIRACAHESSDAGCRMNSSDIRAYQFGWMDGMAESSIHPFMSTSQA